MRTILFLLLVALNASVIAGPVVLEIRWSPPTDDDRVSYFEYQFKVDDTYTAIGSQQVVDGGLEYKAHFLTEQLGTYAFRGRSCNDNGCSDWVESNTIELTELDLHPPTHVIVLNEFGIIARPVTQTP